SPSLSPLFPYTTLFRSHRNVRGAHRGGASPPPPPRFLECPRTGPRGNPGGDRGRRPAPEEPCPADPERPPGRGVPRGARRAAPRAESERPRLRLDGIRGAPR